MKTFAVLVLLIFSTLVQAQTPNENPLSADGFLDTKTLTAHQVSVLKINLALPEGYRAYGDKFKVEIESI